MRLAVLRLLSILAGLMLALGVLEATCRLLPVTSVPLMLPVDAESPIAHFPAGMPFQLTTGWDLAYPVEGHSNNAGYINDIDYDAAASSPLLAVVGDSFVMAMIVPYAQSLQGRLSAAIGDQGRVYSFGMSGAPLSQYLVWAEHAARTYHPGGLVIPVIANDFDESLLDYKVGKGGALYGGFHYYRESHGRLELTLVPHGAMRWLSLLQSSAFARYLIYNVKAQRIEFRQAIARLFGLAPPVSDPDEARLRSIFEPAFFEAWEDREPLSRRAVDAFLDDLPRRTGLAQDRIAFAIDGLRTGILVPRLMPSAERSFFGRMRAYFMAEARRRGFEVVDLQQPFAEHVARTGEHLEFERDYHWNATGYAVAAEAIRHTRVFERLFGRATQTAAGNPG